MHRNVNGVVDLRTSLKNLNIEAMIKMHKIMHQVGMRYSLSSSASSIAWVTRPTISC